MVTPITEVLDPIGPTPSRDDPENFDDEADLTMSQLEDLPPSMNTWTSQVNVLAGEVNDLAAQTALDATASAASAVAALANANATAWVSMQSYAFPDVTVSPGNAHTYRKRTAASASATEPKDDPTNWLPLTLKSIPPEERTANAIITEDDRGKFIDITSGTFTQTKTSAATLGAGFYFFYRNSGSGEITHPDSDGRTNWKQYQHETRLWLSDGTDWVSCWMTPFEISGSTSITFIPPPGYTAVNGEFWAAGGGGGSGASITSGNDTTAGTAGGAGGFARRVFRTSVLGSSIVLTVPAGGVGGAGVTSGSGNPGTAGGSLTFGTLLSITGGSQGVGGANSGGSANGGAGGIAPGVGAVGSPTGGNVVGPGSPGGAGGSAMESGTGGGAGGSRNAAAAVFNGGTSGYRGHTSDPVSAAGVGHLTTPTAGADGADFHGGGGGGAGGSVPAGRGGDAGRASGGGGGGACISGFLSGRGGNGGDGYFILRGI